MYQSIERLNNKAASKSTTSNFQNTKQLLPALNLNALSACPRRGGYLKVLLPRKVNFSSASDFASQTKFGSTDSKCNTVSRSSLRSKSKLSICSSRSSIASANHNFNNSDNLLAITISCVMMMASNEQQIDSKYFMFAERYLSCIKDNSGNIPPNIKGILNHIKYLQRERSPNGSLSQLNTTLAGNNCLNKANRSESSIKTNDRNFNIEANNLKAKIVAIKDCSKSRIPKRSKRIIKPSESKLQ